MSAWLRCHWISFRLWRSRQRVEELQYLFNATLGHASLLQERIHEERLKIRRLRTRLEACTTGEVKKSDALTSSAISPKGFGMKSGSPLH